MKRETISKAVSNMSDQYIEEALGVGADACGKRKRTKYWILQRVGSIAACLAIVVTAVIGVYRTGNANKTAGNDIFSCSWPTVITDLKPEENTVPVKTWDEKSISEKYWHFEYEESEFSSRVTAIEADKLGEKVGEAVLFGTDDINNVTYSTFGAVYSINGINKQCALAVKLEDAYYVYVNSYYKPTTLGEFTEALSLRENASFGAIYCLKWADNGKTIDTIRFTGLDGQYVWSMLLDDLSLENVKDYDHMMLAPIMTIGVDVPVLGYKNISIGLTDDGYLTTNILDTGKAFFIGKDKVEAFMNFVAENCEGVRIVYNGETVPDLETFS